MFVLDQIREIAARDPHRTALRAAGQSITYRELVTAATRLGEHLRTRQAGPEDVVATSLPRGGNAVIAMLGIWMSGAAYLPTDEKWPQRRLSTVLAESASHVLEEGPGADAPVFMPGESGLRVRRLGDGAAHRPPGGASAQNLAYVLHTSGSTGVPHPVGVEFGALDNYARYLHELLAHAPALADRDRTVLLSANLCFDASLRPVCLLAAGATLVMAPDLRDGSWQEHIDCVADNQVTILSGVPSWYSGLLGAGFSPRESGVRLAFVGGEAVPNGMVRELTSQGVTALVQYGPTETTVAATGGILATDDFTEPPIGEAIPGARVHLYGADGATRTTEGEPGFLYVGGSGVARGYLNNPRLTAERFVPNPSGPPGSRMFRTGDLGRMLPRDGYSFLGRQDDQVKIAGRRIELGEISAVLNGHPEVTQSVVFAHQGGGHPRLVACYVARSGAGHPRLDVRIREALAEELPDYLVPAVIRRMADLPLTAHGKADIAALTTLIDGGGSEAGTDDTGLDEVERRLLALVRKTLGVPCTLDDDFFALGGGSLDALDVLARIREDFGVRVRLRDFFQRRTVRALRDLIGDVE